jgi:hypothetical protein
LTSCDFSPAHVGARNGRVRDAVPPAVRQLRQALRSGKFIFLHWLTTGNLNFHSPTVALSLFLFLPSLDDRLGSATSAWHAPSARVPSIASLPTIRAAKSSEGGRGHTYSRRLPLLRSTRAWSLPISPKRPRLRVPPSKTPDFLCFLAATPLPKRK